MSKLNNPFSSEREAAPNKSPAIYQREDVIFAAEHFLQDTEQNMAIGPAALPEQPLTTVTDINVYRESKAKVSLVQEDNAAQTAPITDTEDSLTQIRSRVDEAHRQIS